MKTFRWRVKEVAVKQGLTSMLLAKQTGINKNTATALWHGRPTRVDLATLARLCEALHCRIEDLLELVDERRTPTLAARSTAHQRRRVGKAAAPLATVPLASATV